MIRVVFFDVGGVLHDDIAEPIAKQIAATLGVDYIDYASVIQQVIDELMCGRCSESQLFHELAHKLKVPIPTQTEGVIEDYFKVHYHRHEEVYALAAEVRSRGYITAIVSNTSAYHYAGWRHDVEGIFDPIILSHEVGAMKPSSEIYEYALHKVGAAPGEVFFVDDRAENVAAAKTIGIHAVQFISAQQLRADLQAASVL